MKKSLAFAYLSIFLGSTLFQAHAASGTWNGTVGDGLWSNAGNWSGATIANGSGFNANFNNLDIVVDATVHLDTARTISTLTFGDTNTATAAGWILDNNGNLANVLTLGTSQTITVNARGTGENREDQRDPRGDFRSHQKRGWHLGAVGSEYLIRASLRGRRHSRCDHRRRPGGGSR